MTGCVSRSLPMPPCSLRLNDRNSTSSGAAIAPELDGTASIGCFLDCAVPPPCRIEVDVEERWTRIRWFWRAASSVLQIICQGLGLILAPTNLKLAYLAASIRSSTLDQHQHPHFSELQSATQDDESSYCDDPLNGGVEQWLDSSSACRLRVPNPPRYRPVRSVKRNIRKDSTDLWTGPFTLEWQRIRDSRMLLVRRLANKPLRSRGELVRCFLTFSLLGQL